MSREQKEGVDYSPDYDTVRISVERLESIWFGCDKNDPTYPDLKGDLENFTIQYLLRKAGVPDTKKNRERAQAAIMLGENFARDDSSTYPGGVFVKGNVVNPEWWKSGLPSCVSFCCNVTGLSTDGRRVTLEPDWVVPDPITGSTR